MICIILAGGIGSRLRKAVPDLPKCLAPVAGRPFLEWQIKLLELAGITHFLLALGHKSEAVVAAIEDTWAKGAAITCVIEPEPLGTAGAISNAMRTAQVEEALVINGDTLIKGSLAPLMTALDLNQGEYMRMGIVRLPDCGRYGAVSLGEKDKVIEFREKTEGRSGFVNAGIYRVNGRALSHAACRPVSLENDVLPKLVNARQLRACQLAGPFIDMGVPEDYQYLSSCYQDFF